MAFFTGWLAKLIGSDGLATMMGDHVKPRAMLMRTAGDALDMLNESGVKDVEVRMKMSLTDEELYRFNIQAAALDEAGNERQRSAGVGGVIPEDGRDWAVALAEAFTAGLAFGYRTGYIRGAENALDITTPRNALPPDPLEDDSASQAK